MAAVTAVDIYGPAGMAPDLVKKINGALVQALNTPETRDKLLTYGVNIVPSTAGRTGEDADGGNENVGRTGARQRLHRRVSCSAPI